MGSYLRKRVHNATEYKGRENYLEAAGYTTSARWVPFLLIRCAEPARFQEQWKRSMLDLMQLENQTDKVGHFFF